MHTLLTEGIKVIKEVHVSRGNLARQVYYSKKKTGVLSYSIQRYIILYVKSIDYPI
jgi:hypothetical protein